MRVELLHLLGCAHDGSGLSLEPTRKSATCSGEIEEGVLSCPKCRRKYSIMEGIPSFLPDEYRAPTEAGASYDSPNEIERQQIAIKDTQAREELAHKFDSACAGSEALILENFDTRTYCKKRLAESLIIRHARPNEGSIILDVGAGYGRFAIEYCRNVMTVVSCDFSLEALKLGRNYILKHGYRNAHYVHCDARLLPFKPRMFDSIVCEEVISHIPSVSWRGDVLREIWRCLKPAGTFVGTVGSFNLVRLLRGYPRECSCPGEIYYIKFRKKELSCLLNRFFDIKQIRRLDCTPGRIWEYDRRLAIKVERLLQRLNLGGVDGNLLFFLCAPKSHGTWRLHSK